MAAAIEIRHVSKHFRLYHEHYTSLKEQMIHFGRIPFEDFVALDDIDIDIEEGTTVGILGHNGSGKSTLLKCVAGILQPNEGEIVTRGRLAALLELGAGFHPELTGRENVFMNASILGLSKRDINGGVRRDRRVLRARQVHRHAGAPLLVGHVHAARVRGRGERRPRHPPRRRGARRSATRRSSASASSASREFQREGRTILFVTHAPDLVRKVCDRGARARPRRARRRRAAGRGGADLPRVAAALRPRRPHRWRRSRPPTRPRTRPDDGEHATHGRRMAASATHRVKITNVAIEHPGSLVGRQWLLPDEAMSIRVSYHADEPTDDLLFGIAIHDEEGNNIFGANTKLIDVPVPVADGDGEVTFDFEHVPLLDGTYLVTLAIQSTDEGTVLRLARSAVPVLGDEPGAHGRAGLAPARGALRRAATRNASKAAVPDRPDCATGDVMSVFQRVKGYVRPKAVRKLDDALAPHYVRQEHVVRALDRAHPLAHRPIRRRGRSGRGARSTAGGARRAGRADARRAARAALASVTGSRRARARSRRRPGDPERQPPRPGRRPLHRRARGRAVAHAPRRSCTASC